MLNVLNYSSYCGDKQLPKVLFLSKMPQRWNQLFLDKFSECYCLEVIYINEHVHRFGFNIFTHEIEKHIESNAISIVFLDIEFYSGFGVDLINILKHCAKLIFVTLDDISFHEFNFINAMYCDLVTCADPIAVLKYREKGIESELLLLENSNQFYLEANLIDKDIDILFFGSLEKGGRREFIDNLINEGFKVVVHSPDMGITIPYSELAHLICRAKIVLNLSQTHVTSSRYESFLPVETYYQFKGRVIEAALGLAVCVSEYAPSVELMFGRDTVLMFKDISDCIDTLHIILGNAGLQKQLATKFNKLTIEKYEQVVQVDLLVKSIDKIVKRQINMNGDIPYKYILAVVIARFLTTRRPLRFWIYDLFCFACFSNVFLLRYRLMSLIMLFYKATVYGVGSLVNFLCKLIPQRSSRIV